MIPAAVAVAPSVHIDVWSDVICPWCYLGHRRLQTALDQLGWQDEVEVRFRAFLLDPRATNEPGDLRRSIEAKYGPGAFDGMARRLVALGEPEAIEYRFDTAVRVTTLEAHRLIGWAWGQGGQAAQTPLVERLFRAYFTEGANVADHQTLVRLAGEAGLDEAAAAALLAGTDGAEEVAEDLVEAHERELTGVPAFLVEERLLIPGAQEVETFVSLLQRTKDRREANR
jgi:predicted DsbA family dithiol-disulfide isomerase